MHRYSDESRTYVEDLHSFPSVSKTLIPARMPAQSVLPQKKHNAHLPQDILPRHMGSTRRKLKDFEIAGFLLDPFFEMADR